MIRRALGGGGGGGGVTQQFRAFHSTGQNQRGDVLQHSLEQVGWCSPPRHPPVRESALLESDAIGCHHHPACARRHVIHRAVNPRSCYQTPSDAIRRHHMPSHAIITRPVFAATSFAAV